MAAECSEAEVIEQRPKIGAQGLPTGQHPTYVYDGLRLSLSMTPAAIEAVKRVKLYPDDLLIITYPKSGTTWVQEIAWLVKQDANTEVAYEKPKNDRITFLEFQHRNQDPEVLRMSQDPPRLIKTHLPAHFFEKHQVNGASKAIVVMRDLKDTLVSFFNHYKMRSLHSYKGTWDMFFELFKEKHLQSGDWGEFYKGWQKYKDDPNFLFLQYEKIKGDPHQAVRMVAKHCDKVLTEKQVDIIVQHTSFEKMKANPKMDIRMIKGFYRKGVIGDWKNYFSDEQISYIEQYEKELNLHD